MTARDEVPDPAEQLRQLGEAFQRGRERAARRLVHGTAWTVGYMGLRVHRHPLDAADTSSGEPLAEQLEELNERARAALGGET